MVAYTNFYETVEESNIRLRHTVILYEGQPYFVLAITNHRGDGIFRIYMEPTGLKKEELSYSQKTAVPCHHYSTNDTRLGPEMDKWLDANPESKILRKTMNSPAFNKFRPFPLGMCNIEGGTYYLERQPNRKTEQGLISSMINSTSLVAASGELRRSGWQDTTKVELRDTILGHYPSQSECLEAVLNNSAVAAAGFHRLFAFVSGPISTVFLAYKDSIVGILPDNSLNRVCLSKKYAHALEVIQDLGIFSTTTVR
jgi:hypothetical protein